MQDIPAYVFDIEADDLLAKVKKIHCLCYKDIFKPDSEIISVTDYEGIKDFFTSGNCTLIGHNVYLYDIPAIEKILDIKVKYTNIVDTLTISHYLHSSKDKSYKHGLEYYGERFGIKKPTITDWNNLTVEEYVHRCTEDVKINTQLWLEQQAQLIEIYEGNGVEIKRLIAYLNSKLDVLLEQQNNPLTLNVELVAKEIFRLEALVKEKREPLLAAMPKLPIKNTIKKPKIMYKADGTLSARGEKWLEVLKSNNLPEDYLGDVEVITGYEEPNPDSVSQLKDWLFSLGWKPTHFKFVRDKRTNESRQVPQIKNEYDDTDICDSVKELVEVEPAIEHLSSYSTIKHRIKIFEGFLNDMNDGGTITGQANGWTNTMRLKHRVLVNLPKPSAPYAECIRECLIAPEGYYMVGADLSAIEDNTKQHYIYPYDPDYVDSMRTEGFDAHLDIAVRANILTQKQVDAHKAGTENYKEQRNKAKVVNFSATYGVGVKTLARNMKVSEKEAKPILEAYWDRNRSLKQFAADCTTNVVNGQMWVKQPVSGFWYTLRSEKDIFSTVNQSSAVYVFDVWLAFVRRLGLKISFQAHDELVALIPKSVPEDEVRAIINKAMERVNEKLKLNVPIGCSMDFGKTYKEVH